MTPQSIGHRLYRAAIFAAALVAAMTATANAADLALTHARIYPSPDAPPIAYGTVLIHDGRIVAIAAGGAARVPRDAERIDVHGAIVTAGFWNSHVHLITPPLLNAERRSDAELTQELTDADPSKDITAFARVRLTVRAGRTIYDAKSP